MECGVSASCLYPMDTIESLCTLQMHGVQTVEVFLNTFSELEPAYLAKLQEQLQCANTRVVSVHPFSSEMETFFFSSDYGARLQDGIALYRRYFDICKMLGADKFIFHGDHRMNPFPFAQHCANYSTLRTIAREEYGVIVCQENVVRCKCGVPEYITQMREYTNDDVDFTLDVKQMRRANVPLAEMLSAMGNRIAHLHLSDADVMSDCTLPCTGIFDFASLFAHVQQYVTDPSMVVELYRGNFDTPAQLKQAADALSSLYQTTL